MVVCICADVNQEKIQEAIQAGHNTHKKLKKCLGVCEQCCKCADAIKEELEKNSQKV